MVPDDVYHGFRKLQEQVFGAWGFHVSYVDMSDPAKIAAVLRPTTRLIWIESPSNPLLKITDLAAVAEIAHQAGVLSACDSTFASPVLQYPPAFGIDMAAHLTTI